MRVNAMIRRMQFTDLDKVSQIWLESNKEAHGFIPAEYWESHLQSVKTALLQAEVYVYVNERRDEILGFIGMNGEYIEGIFVDGRARSLGIGRELLEFVKVKKDRLKLHVYVKNERAVRFYKREGFRIIRTLIDEGTGEEEYIMIYGPAGSAV